MPEITTPPANPRTIVLRGSRGQVRIEGRVAVGATILPGMLVENDTVHQHPYATYKPHSTAAGVAEKLIAEELGMVADIPGQTFKGGTVNDTYVAGDLVFIHQCIPGDEVWALLPASAAAVILTDFLTSNGDGTLKKGATTDVRLFKPLEAKDNSAVSTSRLRIRARAL